MQKLKILNSKEVKKISARLEEQYGVFLPKEKAYLLSSNDKLYMINKEFALIDDKNIRIDTLGLYIATISSHTIRLSIEGSQLLGPKATKSVVEIENSDSWMKGENISIEKGLKGAIIVKCKDDFLGCGLAKDGILINHIPKERRMN